MILVVTRFTYHLLLDMSSSLCINPPAPLAHPFGHPFGHPFLQPTTVLSLKRDEFTRLLGPLKDLISETAAASRS